jgi:hypothetical protein
MSFFEKDIDLKKPIRTFKYLKKGGGRKAHNNHVGEPHKFLKKGDGSLASENHGETEFAKKRKEQIISDQIQRESEYRKSE